MAKALVKQNVKACTHKIRIYEEAVLPELKWKCVECNICGTSSDSDMKYLHTNEEIGTLLDSEV